MREVIEKTWGWDEAWQQTDFERRLAAYIVSIIEAEGRAAGSLWLEWKPDSLYIHEVQILPDFQGQGLGTAVVQGVLEQGARRALPVTLS
jgi:GNAT superfamily N-acetyltransferase